MFGYNNLIEDYKDCYPIVVMTFADCLMTYLFACLQGMSHPHDVTVDSANHMVYVGELNPPKVWQFQMDPALYTGIQWSRVQLLGRYLLKFQ